MEGWEVVLTLSSEMEIGYYKSILDSADIPAEVLDQLDSTRNFTLGELSIVKLLVPAEYAIEARDIIEKVQKANLEDENPENLIEE